MAKKKEVIKYLVADWDGVREFNSLEDVYDYFIDNPDDQVEDSDVYEIKAKFTVCLEPKIAKLIKKY